MEEVVVKVVEEVVVVDCGAGGWGGERLPLPWWTWKKNKNANSNDLFQEPFSHRGTNA